MEVPPELDPAIAACSRMAGVSISALLVAEIRGNPWVAVFGLGMVGNLTAQFFMQRGCRVIGLDPNSARREVARRCGIECVLGGTDEEVQRSILDLTEGSGAQITLDAVGHSRVVMQCLRATAPRGQLILLGTPRVPVEGDLTELLRDIHIRRITVRGALEGGLPSFPDPSGRDSLYSAQIMIFDWIRRGLLKLEPQLSHRLKPSEIKKAYDGLLTQPDLNTGVALDWR